MLKDIQRFLDINAFPRQHPDRPDLRRGLYPFVTISRQVGAGGRSLARALVLELEKQPNPDFHKWKIFDRDLCERLVEDKELRLSLRKLWSEEYHSEIEELILSLLGGSSSQPVAVKKLFEAIRSVAILGKVIIVGRAGSCVTASLPQGVHLRLVASEDSRIERMKLTPLGEAESRKVLRRQDRGRERLVRTYFRKEISDPLLYDAVWNTDMVPIEVIASAVVALIQHKSHLAELQTTTLPAAR
jgi:hypothetical protein